MFQKIMIGMNVLFALLLASPSRDHRTDRVGIVAGDGGWDLEDANHYRKK